MSQGSDAGGDILVVGGRVPGDRFERSLEAAGFTVRVAADPKDAPLDEVGCVVLSTEDDDARSSIESVRARRRNVPVVFLGPDDGRVASEAVAAGASEFVPRTLPDAPAVLVDRVRSALDASSATPRTADGGSDVATMPADEDRRLKERAMDEAPVGITIADADRQDTPLVYANGRFEHVTGYPLEETIGRNCRFLQGEDTDDDPVQTLREAIESERPTTVELRNYRKDGTPFWNEVTIAPVPDDDGRVTHFVGFQNDVTTRKEAERALERERASLDHLLDRINGLLGSVHGDLVEATSREGVEEAVCGRIADEAAYSWAWLARPDSARNALAVAAGAGSSAAPGDGLEASLIGDDADYRTPLSRLLTTAFETERVEILDNPEALDALAASDPGVSEDLAGIAAIPLVYRETCYGVLTIATTDADALDEREMVVLQAIARATATAINAIERGRLLSTDAVTEIEFELGDRDLFVVDLSARLDAEVVYDGGIFQDDGSGRLFCTVAADPEAVASAIADSDVEASVVTAFEDSALVAVTVGPDSIVGRLAERGGRIRSMVAEEGVCTLSVEIPATTDARAVVSTLEDRHPTIQLRSFRERDRPPTTRQAFAEELRDRLTERQRTAITVAYVSGFYEWDRSVSGDELADSMGITRSTFHQHRRAAERKLIGAVVDG
jgi:PAS domain S-box-containing protein